jgi:nitroreductase
MLDDSEIQKILEYGRLTPTSFGLELWSFHVVKGPEAKEALFHACFDQESVRNQCNDRCCAGPPSPFAILTAIWYTAAASGSRSLASLHRRLPTL